MTHLFALELDDDADGDAVTAQLLELAALPGCTLITFEGNIVAEPHEDDAP